MRDPAYSPSVLEAGSRIKAWHGWTRRNRRHHCERKLLERLHQADGREQPVGLAVEDDMKRTKQTRVSVIKRIVVDGCRRLRRVASQGRIRHYRIDTVGIERNRLAGIGEVWRRSLVRHQRLSMKNLGVAIVVCRLVLRIEWRRIRTFTLLHNRIDRSGSRFYVVNRSQLRRREPLRQLIARIACENVLLLR